MNNYLAAIRLFNRDIRLLMTASALFGFVFFGIYALLLNLYLLRLGYGPEFIGLTNAVGPLVLAVASLPIGLLSRRIGSRRGLFIAFFFTAVSLTLLPLGENLAAPWSARWIVAMYAWTWLSGAFMLVNIGPFIMCATAVKERSYAFSFQAALFPVAGFAGNLLGGLLPGLLALILGTTLDEATPYRYALLLAGPLPFLAALAMWKAKDVHVEPAKTERTTRTERMTRSPMPVVLIGVISLVWLLRIGSEWTMRIFFNVYLDTALGASTALIGMLLAAGQLLGLASLFAPYAILRWGQKRTLVGAMVGMALAFIPLILISHWFAVGAGFVALMAMTSLSAPVYSLFSQESVAPSWQTTIASSMSMGLGIGVAAVAFGGGYIILSFGYPMLFAAGAALAIFAALLFAVYFQMPRGEEALSGADIRQGT